MAAKNLFLIGRRRGAEGQLTEMLAFLWERQPEFLQRWLTAVDSLEAPAGDWRVATQVVEPGVGRFDMTLVLEDQAFVVVESKLGAELGPEQLGRYVGYVALRQEPIRAVVSLTERAEHRSPELEAKHGRRGSRWLRAGRSWRRRRRIPSRPAMSATSSGC